MGVNIKKDDIFKNLKSLIEINGESALYSDSKCTKGTGRGYEGLNGLIYIIEYDNPDAIQVFRGEKEIMTIDKNSDLMLVLDDLKWLGMMD